MPERPIGITKDSPITFVELPATSGGKLDAPGVVDVYSRLRLPPRAIPLLHGVLSQAGYQDVVSIAPQYNPGLKLTKDDQQRIFGSNVLALSSITRTMPQTEQLAREYKELNPKGRVVVGGAHATALPEECLEWADIVVRGEGEKTLQELMMALEDNGSPKGVKGISYKDGDGIVHELDRELLSEQELDGLPDPVYSEAVRKGVKINVVWTSRGCTGKCNYCFVPILYGDCYRRKSNEVNIAQFQVSPRGPGVTFILDDNFMGKPRQTKEFLVSMKESGLNARAWVAQLRAQAGLIPGAPKLLCDAGVRTVTVGFESLSDETLKEIGKTTTADQNREGARALKEEDIHIHGMFVVGLDGDTPESAREIVEFAKMYCDTAQFFAISPVYGTGFAAAMTDQDRILTRDYSLYDGQNVIVRPKNFSPHELQQTIFEMYRQFYDPKVFLGKVKNSVFGRTSVATRRSVSQTIHDLGYDLMIRLYAGDALRSFNNDPQTQKHLVFLKSVS